MKRKKKTEEGEKKSPNAPGKTKSTAGEQQKARERKKKISQIETNAEA
jgi:hypothetical protein